MYGIEGTAKRPLKVDGLEIKLGSAYDIFCSCSIEHYEENESEREGKKIESSWAKLELIDGSGAFYSVAVGIASIVSTLAF